MLRVLMNPRASVHVGTDYIFKEHAGLRGRMERGRNLAIKRIRGASARLACEMARAASVSTAR